MAIRLVEVVGRSEAWIVGALEDVGRCGYSCFFLHLCICVSQHRRGLRELCCS
uniref:Uncharacterized protein n=1 Tax=Physcomitrium patens TaxID=3218 RepID=A0A2K1JXM1_PHYPA|nr:hypothetical protein PHYPA_013393 [Physcomitrium patens]